MSFPISLYYQSGKNINPQYRMALENWFNEINLMTWETEKLIQNLQRIRLIEFDKFNAKKNKIIKAMPG